MFKLLIQTKFFGEIEICDNDVIYFDEGLLGLEDLKKYVLLDAGEDVNFKILQSLENKDIAFMVMNPWDIFSEYKLELDDDELSSFKDRDINNLFVFSILTVREDRITANLLGPIVINFKSHEGRQIVLHKSDYTTKHIIKLFEKKE